MIGTVTHQQIAEAVGRTKRTVERRAVREKWPFTEETTLGGTQRLYSKADLPADVQAKLVLLEAAAGSAIGRGAVIAAAIEAKVGKRTAEESLVELQRLHGGRRERAEAVLNILGAVDRYIELSQLPLTRALDQFCAAYNDGDHHHLDPATTNIFKELSSATVYRWRRDLKNLGVEKVAGKYGNRKGESLIETQPDLLQFCIALVTEFPHINARSLRDGALARFKKDKAIKMPGERAVQRWLNAWKAENKQLLMAVANPDAWKNGYMTAFGSQSEGIDRLNQLWEVDGTPADVICKDGRYQIIGAIDVHSRRGMLHVVRTQKAVSVAAMLRRCLLEWGVAEGVKSDNGADYKSKHVTRVFELLHIAHAFSDPFSGWQKPHIERFFRTFAHGLVELMPTFIGHNVAQREQLRARQSFADRLFKKGEAVEINLTAAELQTFCDRWLDDVYMHAPHAGLNDKTPFEMVAAYTGELRRIENPRALDILLAETDGDGIRTVTKKGIRIRNGLYIAAELGLHVGSEVRVLEDAADLGRIYVFTLTNDFICIAEDPTLTGVSRQEVAAVARQRQAKRIQEARAELKRAAKEQNVKEIAGEILDYKAEQRRSLTPFPKRSVAHTTPALAAAEVALGVADMRDRPPEQRPVDEAALAEVVELVRTEQQQEPVEEQRFRRWYGLDQKRAAGVAVSEFDTKWMQSYELTAEFEARKQMLDGFGPEAFGLEVTSA